jgi:predicted enzyme related to lactoylglutathione lyase
MRVRASSVPVDDQAHALKFYTEVLGFVKKLDIPVGEHHRWLTVVAPDDLDGVELLLEPSEYPAMQALKKSLVADGIPYTMFEVDDVHAEYERLRSLEVEFTMEPTDLGTTIAAILNDTCGNLIQIYQLTDSALG